MASLFVNHFTLNQKNCVSADSLLDYSFFLIFQFLYFLIRCYERKCLSKHSGLEKGWRCKLETSAESLVDSAVHDGSQLCHMKMIK